MTHIEFVAWLEEEVAGRRMTSAQRDDLVSQKVLFDGNRDYIRREFRNRIVGYVDGVLLSDGDLQALLATVKSKFPDRLIYFEQIDFNLI